MKPSDLHQKIYHRRLGGDTEFRNRLYQVLCSDFFQKYISEDATVLEVGAGYCEFINSIKTRKKIALDLNPDVKKFAEGDVEVVIASSANMEQIKNKSVDVVFANNFFEHLSREYIIETITEVYRVLNGGGKFLILQPNIRFF